MLVRFEEHVELLKSREGGRIAKQIFKQLLGNATHNDPVVFDFDNIASISSSFADEFFGMLIQEMGFEQFKSVTTFRNLNPFVSNVIRNSIYHRNTKEFAKA